MTRTKPNPKYNFINEKTGYFRKGKYKDVHITKVSKNYLEWVIENVLLNPSERRMLNNRIKKVVKYLDN
jgi:hypothetical protein